MEELTRLIREDMKPALGVTEPGAIAFAAARAKAETEGEVLRVDVALNSGMYKNAYTCGIPGSDAYGNLQAAALGVVAADPAKGLESLDGITDADNEAAAAENTQPEQPNVTETVQPPITEPPKAETPPPCQSAPNAESRYNMPYYGSTKSNDAPPVPQAAKSTPAPAERAEQ